MSVFTFLIVLVIWYVDYDSMKVVGFGTNPFGYDSVAYHVLNEVFRVNSYRDRQSNFLWVVSQVSPLLLSWPIRSYLGSVAGFVMRLGQKIYRAV